MRFAAATARRLGLPESDITAMDAAALLHDVGMMTIPRSLVDKPADFTSEERSIIRQHPLIAYNLLQRHTELAPITALILSALRRVRRARISAGTGRRGTAYGQPHSRRRDGL